MEATLGISLGTRSIGVAVLFGKELIKWNLHWYPGKWSQNKSKLIVNSIAKLLKTYEPSLVAVKIPKDINKSPNTNRLIGAINVLAEGFSLKAQYYSLDEIKQHYCPKEITNKSSLIECIVTKHPELHHLYSRDANLRNSYYSKVFEAVAVAHIGSTVTK